MVKTHFIIGRACNKAPMPNPVTAAMMPTPTTIPAICGNVRAKPNRAPDVVTKITFGPGENSPRNTNPINDALSKEVFFSQLKIRFDPALFQFDKFTPQGGALGTIHEVFG